MGWRRQARIQNLTPALYIPGVAPFCKLIPHVSVCPCLASSPKRRYGSQIRLSFPLLSQGSHPEALGLRQAHPWTKTSGRAICVPHFPLPERQCEASTPPPLPLHTRWRQLPPTSSYCPLCMASVQQPFFQPDLVNSALSPTLHIALEPVNLLICACWSPPPH